MQSGKCLRRYAVTLASSLRPYPQVAKTGCNSRFRAADRFPHLLSDGDYPESNDTENLMKLGFIGTGRAMPSSGEAFGGQWRQRVPKSLHAALARRAEHEGVSLNMLVTTLLAEGIGRRIGG